MEVLGFSEVPAAGDEFEVYLDEKAARSVVGDRASGARATRLASRWPRRVSLTSMSTGQRGLKELNLILKADVQGSVEAILGMLEQLPQGEVQVRVLLCTGRGHRNRRRSAAAGAVIVGFNTTWRRCPSDAGLAGVDVRDYDVIYKLLEDIQAAMEGLLEPELWNRRAKPRCARSSALARALWLVAMSPAAAFSATARSASIAAKRWCSAAISIRRRMKNDVEVNTGFECGMGCDRFADWQEGDRVEAFAMVTRRTGHLNGGLAPRLSLALLPLELLLLQLVLAGGNPGPAPRLEMVLLWALAVLLPQLRPHGCCRSPW